MSVLVDTALMLSAAILMIAALWHVYWAAGGRVGFASAIPERDGVPAFTPSAGVTLAVAALIGGVALFYVAASSWFEFPLRAHTGFVVLLALAGAVFVARAIGDFSQVGFFNRGGQTAFAVADRTLYAPLCLFLGVTGLAAAALRLM